MPSAGSAPDTALLRGALACALRRPWIWAAAVALVAVAPMLETLGAEGGLALRWGGSALWMKDVGWLGAVAGGALGIGWLAHQPGLRALRAGWQAWRSEAAVVLAAALLGWGLAMLVPLGTGWLPGPGDLRLLGHLGLVGLLVLGAFHGPVGPVAAYLALVWLLPAGLGRWEDPSGLRATLLALVDPRSSNAAGWWTVAALALAVIAQRVRSPRAP